MTNTLYTGDNLYILNGMNSDSVDLIYLDPPFNSKRLYKAPIGSKAKGTKFSDIWKWKDVDEECLIKLFLNYPHMVQFIRSIEGLHSKAMMAYITYMAQRIIELYRVLKSTGSFYLHCDPTASHYLKIVLDRVFGKNNFRNEIIWHYGGPVRMSNKFPSKSDVLLFYSKEDTNTFNQPYGPLPEYLYERARSDIDGRLWVDQRLGVTGEKLKQYRNEGRTFMTKRGGERLKQYLDEMDGKPIDNVWSIPIINSQSNERTGYPTQKPLALLHRIIQASSNAGDMVLDPFCGCATTCVAAQQLAREWIGIDLEEQAATLVMERLEDDAGLFTEFTHTTTIPNRTDVELISSKGKGTKGRLYEEQKGSCNGCKLEFDIQNFEIDHKIPKSKGGGDYYENYQLLCGNCNRTKGNRPMEYLMKRVQERESVLKYSISFTN